MVVAGLSFWLNARLASSQLNQQYENRALAIAHTVADMPQVVQALSRTGPVSAVQPITLRVAHSTGANFVVVVDRKGIRLSFRNPAGVGKWFGEAVASLDGRDHVRIRPSPVPSANAGVPVFGADGTVIGQVSVGYYERQVAAAWWRTLGATAVATGVALLLGVLVSFVLARQLKRITFGLELDEIADLLSEVEDLAVEQAALRRVATLVARSAPPEEVFAVVTEEAGRLFTADVAIMNRYAPDGTWAVTG